jgi:hypothetical protein
MNHLLMRQSILRRKRDGEAEVAHFDWAARQQTDFSVASVVPVTDPELAEAALKNLAIFPT